MLKSFAGDARHVILATGYEQLCLFEETTELAKALLKEQETIVVKEHKRTPRKPGIRKEMLACLPKEIEEYIIEEKEKCSVCGGELEVIGKEIVRTEVEFRPAMLIVKQIVRQVAKCKVCGSNGNDTLGHIQKASVPARVLPHSIATHSLVAQIMYQKFGMGAPFATARRAWLFADTLNGARANAVLYTLVETARANDLNVYAYLDYLLTEMPNADFYNHPEIIDDMLPWSDKLPESCRLIHKHKKSFKK